MLAAAHKTEPRRYHPTCTVASTRERRAGDPMVQIARLEAGPPADDTLALRARRAMTVHTTRRVNALLLTDALH